jgi:hypothetical protein
MRLATLPSNSQLAMLGLNPAGTWLLPRHLYVMLVACMPYIGNVSFDNLELSHVQTMQLTVSKFAVFELVIAHNSAGCYCCASTRHSLTIAPTLL